MHGVSASERISVIAQIRNLVYFVNNEEGYVCETVEADGMKVKSVDRKRVNLGKFLALCMFFCGVISLHCICKGTELTSWFFEPCKELLSA